MDFLKKLHTPEELADLYSISKELKMKKHLHDVEIKKIFSGESKKFILAIGPCSADREDSVIDYVKRLAVVQEKVKDHILIVPRIYTSKPRTIGNGYKGMIHQPYIGKREDMAAGVVAVRKLHARVIEESGLFPVDELLYPEMIHYLADLLGYVVIGARSVENQEHRLVSSGINVPVGMKNPVGGSIDVMLNAIETAQHPHHFLFSGWEVISRGNEFAHAVLRGYVAADGTVTPNYRLNDLIEIINLYKARNLENPAFIIDCNHSNSNKQYLKQVDISMDVLNSMKQNADVKQMVKGLMIESYLVDGCQKVGNDVYGQSITDPCIGWEKTEQLIYDIDKKLRELYD